MLEQSREMEERLRLFDRSRRTLSVGGCAPVPLWDLFPLLSRLYPQMNVSTEMKNSDEELLAGLNKEMYQLIVTHSPRILICMGNHSEQSVCSFRSLWSTL